MGPYIYIYIPSRVRKTDMKRSVEKAPRGCGLGRDRASNNGPSLGCHYDPKTPRKKNQANSSRPPTPMLVRARAHGREIDHDRLGEVCKKVCDEKTAGGIE